jgi:hypothetical protein
VSWWKSTRSGTGNCVEVANAGGNLLVRNSKHPDGPILAFTKAEWRAFLAGAKDGEFDEDTQWAEA